MTTVECSRVSNGREAHYAQGWTVSVLCHLFGIGGALVFLAEIEKPVLLNTFQWEIAMVEAPAVVAPAPAPPTPTPLSPHQADRLIAPRPPAETVQAVQQTAVRDMAAPVEAVSERSAVQTKESPTVVTQETTTNHESVVEQTASTPITPAAMERVEPVGEQVAVAYASEVRQAEVVTRAPSRPDPQSSEIEHRVVQHRLVTVRQTQADYGWLQDALWGRIEELKRYPAQARANHWEGKVVVEVVIRDDGTVVNLQVAESSGRVILDQEALAVMRKASPLILKHPLGKPSITLLVPISYKLDG